MTRNRLPKNRVSTQGPRRRRGRVRATLGDLIAATYDALGPGARSEDVARVLAAPTFARALSRRVRVA